jgi:FkbM family methyltransferase
LASALPDAVVRAVRQGSVSFTVEVRPGQRFWDDYETGWERCTVAIFEERLGPGTRYLDLGAFIGPTVLYAAALGCEVAALEPDPAVFAELERNVAVNPELAPRIRLSPAALALADGRTELHVGIGSLASLLGEGKTVEVPTISPETLAEQVGELDFVKIDVEGAEYLFLPRLVAALRGKPAIYLSTHPGHLLDRHSALSLLRSIPRAALLNRRMLRALRGYRSQRVYDDDGGHREIRGRNALRTAIPFAGRASFLIDNCLFAD